MNKWMTGESYTVYAKDELNGCIYEPDLSGDSLNSVFEDMEE